MIVEQQHHPDWDQTYSENNLRIYIWRLLWADLPTKLFSGTTGLFGRLSSTTALISFTEMVLRKI